jgi:hypothetical protein
MNSLKSLCSLVSAISLAACTSTVSLQVMKPAPVTIPANIKSIAIIDRTTPSNKTANIIEGALSGELPGQDRQAVQKVIDGISYTMQQSPRFEIKRTNISLTSDGIGGAMPQPLRWFQVADICRSNNSDAILSLESFDTDFIITNASKQVEKKQADNKTITVTEYTAAGVGKVKLGLRMYDPANKNIIDFYTFDHSSTWNATGNSVKDAIAHLVDRINAVNQVSYTAGNIYAERICPLWFTVNRPFYKKSQKNTDFALAARKADVGDWKTAAEQWKQVLASNPPIKTAGRAAYNIAICYEVLGDLSQAKQWAMKAYSDYNNKNGRNYVSILDQRIWEQEKLQQQLSNQ